MTQKSVVDLAKEQVIAYNEKDWDRARAALAPEVVYDELGTQRKVKGVSAVLPPGRMGTALPDFPRHVPWELGRAHTAVLRELDGKPKGR